MSPVYRERTAGIYRSTFLGTTDVEFTDADTGEKQERWDWQFQEVADPSSTGLISRMTPRSLRSPNSNAYKFASGIMGRKLQPEDDTDTMKGQVYDVVYGPNQAGNLAITSVVKVQDAPQPVQDAPGGAEGWKAAQDATIPDLPF
jgi:hypothetical protein